MKRKLFLVAMNCGLVALTIYLFLTGHIEAFPEETTLAKPIPIETAFKILDAENSKVRALWTKHIVGAGKGVGLAFKEEWRAEDVSAGPLPALFLREVAAFLYEDEVPLSLYLGSEFPINDVNSFGGLQQEMFEILEESHEPQFFYAQDTDRYLAMFEDVAAVDGCVTCHNEHPQSPKTDWVLGDVMGAITWSYPAEEVTAEELMAMIAALRSGVAYAYGEYMAEVQTFSDPPEVGAKWPSDGYYLPTTDDFMAEVNEIVSPETLSAILEATEVAAKDDSLASIGAAQ